MKITNFIQTSLSYSMFVFLKSSRHWIIVGHFSLILFNLSLKEMSEISASAVFPPSSLFLFPEWLINYFSSLLLVLYKLTFIFFFLANPLIITFWMQP